VNSGLNQPVLSNASFKSVMLDETTGSYRLETNLDGRDLRNSPEKVKQCRIFIVTRRKPILIEHLKSMFAFEFH